MKTKLNLMTVIEGSLWRSESGDTRVSKLGSEWNYTVQRFIGGEVRESFSSKSAMLRWLKSKNISVALKG